MGRPQALLREHFLQDPQALVESNRGQTPHPSDEPVPIGGADLVKDHVSRLPLESTWDAEGVRVSPGGHGRYDEGLKMGIQCPARQLGVTHSLQIDDSAHSPFVASTTSEGSGQPMQAYR